MTELERFEEKFIPEPNSGCWLWTAALAHPPPGDYGVFKIGGRQRGAHVASWMLHRGPTGDKWVLHKCDTPSCVNPDHLYLGDVKTNAADRVRRNRSATGQLNGAFTKPDRRPTGQRHGSVTKPWRVPRGDRSGSIKKPWTRPRGSAHWTARNPASVPRGTSVVTAKLTDEDVLEIRQRSGAGTTGRALALMFGVSRSTISSIIRRHTWIHFCWLVIMTASIAHAEPYRPSIIPECRIYASPGISAGVCGYADLADVHALYGYDLELVELRALVPILRRQLAASVEAHRQAAARADAEAAGRAALEDRRAVLVTAYLDLDRRYQAERVRPRIGGRWGWTVAAALGATLLVVVAHDALE